MHLGLPLLVHHLVEGEKDRDEKEREEDVKEVEKRYGEGRDRGENEGGE